MSRTKTENVECSDVTHVKIETHGISKRGSFKYLRCTIQGNGEINEDVTYRIRGRDEWRLPVFVR